jgi:mono/diheme cytochrome c family protein
MGQGGGMKTALALAAVLAMGAAALLGLPLLQPGPQDRGQALYAENCASCHGVNLEGQENWRIQKADGTLPAPPHNAEGHTWHHDDGLLFDYTKLGGESAMAARGVTGFASGMPAFGDILTDEQINDIWAYIKSTWSDRERNVQSERTAAALDAES